MAFALDKTDIKLLNALESDARRPLRKVGRDIGASAVTVMNRMKALEKAGVIKGYTAKLGPVKIGFELTAVISVKVKGGQLIAVQQRIAKDPHVCGVYDTTGDFDSVVIARFKNVRDLNSFIKKTLASEGIERTVTQIALNVIKEDFNSFGGLNE